jgi:hypothetical protein
MLSCIVIVSDLRPLLEKPHTLAERNAQDRQHWSEAQVADGCAVDAVSRIDFGGVLTG